MIKIIRGSLLDQNVDVIVNAANIRLKPGGGIDGLIHRQAGPKLYEFLNRHYPYGLKCSGEVALSPGFGLKQNYIIHTAGPIWRDYDYEDVYNKSTCLANCYTNSLHMAHAFGWRDLAFCSISTGIYGYPLELAIPVAVNAIESFITKYSMNVTIALFGEEEFNAYTKCVNYIAL